MDSIAIQNVLMNHCNNPSTRAVIDAIHSGHNPNGCIHLQALTVECLRKRHHQSAALPQQPTLPMPVLFQFLPHTIRLFARLVDQRWVFLRYSTDYRKFFCLTCKLSSHCSHWYNFQYDGSEFPQASRSVEVPVQERVQQEILRNTNADGFLHSTGLSIIKYPIYSFRQKQILENRSAWLDSILLSELKSIPGKHNCNLCSAGA